MGGALLDLDGLLDGAVAAAKSGVAGKIDLEINEEERRAFADKVGWGCCLLAFVR